MARVDPLEASEICAAFGLSPLRRSPRIAAKGSGGINRVWRFDADDRSWAVKEVRRELPDGHELAFVIEEAAVRAGVAAPVPLRSRHGHIYEPLGDSHVRVHTWAEGAAKTNETVTATEAADMGRIVARLHGMALPAWARPRRTGFDADHWRRLAAAGRACGAHWAEVILERLDDIAQIEAELTATMDSEGPLIGSHRDLNAHNVLFSDLGLVLVDWDAAGPTTAQFERASYAVLWGSGHGGYDPERTTAFLRGYLDAGGQLDRSDPAALPEWGWGLLHWTEQNMRLALEQIEPDQNRTAEYLLSALLRASSTVQEQQDLLAHCLRGLV
jgi:Ser/Thr protein kinase RdoA (MazF antagonist)